VPNAVPYSVSQPFVQLLKVIGDLSSAFDYLSNLIFYISLKEDTNSKWSNVAKAVRQGKLKGLTFSSLIDDLDRTFVNQLYGYRSQVIHYKEDRIGSSLSVEFDQENVYAKFSSSTKFNQNFKELRELQKDFDLSISYVLMWLLNKTTDSIIAIQLELKHFIEENKKNKAPLFYLKGKDGEKIPYTDSIWKNKDD